MKIDKPDQIANRQQVQEPQKTKSADPSEFKRLLSRMAAQEKTACEPGSTAGLTDIQPLAPLRYIETDIPLIDMTQKAIDLLDQYSNDINNPQKSLKEIEPVLMNLLETAESASRTLSEKNVSDPELGNLIDEILFNARMEHFKFQRGDYI